MGGNHYSFCSNRPLRIFCSFFFFYFHIYSCYPCICPSSVALPEYLPRFFSEIFFFFFFDVFHSLLHSVEYFVRSPTPTLSRSVYFSCKNRCFVTDLMVFFYFFIACCLFSHEQSVSYIFVILYPSVATSPSLAGVWSLQISAVNKYHPEEGRLG